MERPASGRKSKTGNEADNKAVFFDIDGTLIGGQIIVEFPLFLEKRGLFGNKHLLKILEYIVEYEVGYISYRDTGCKILEEYAGGLCGLEKAMIEKEARKFMKEHIKRKYEYTLPLVKLFRKNTVLVALSASPIEVVLALRKYIPFDYVYGTELETRNGVYTGKVCRNLLDAGSKHKAQLLLSKKLGIDLKKSFAFGDSDADIEYLSAVGKPVALNPNHRLKDFADENKWSVFSKKDDVVGGIKKILGRE